MQVVLPPLTRETVAQLRADTVGRAGEDTVIKEPVPLITAFAPEALAAEILDIEIAADVDAIKNTFATTPSPMPLLFIP